MYIIVNFIFIKFLKNFGLTMIALCSVIPPSQIIDIRIWFFIYTLKIPFHTS